MDASLMQGLDFAGAGLAFALTTLALLLLQPLAGWLNLLDHPNDSRKDHAHPTPVTGGIAILIGCLVAFFGMQASTASVQAFSAAAVLLVVVGIYDDLHDLRWYWRILAQSLAALIIIYWGGVRVEQLGPLFGLGETSLGALSVPFTVFATVGIINAMNMIDGADGLAGLLGLAALAMLSAAALYAGNAGLASRLSVLCGALAAFLAWNVRLPWRPRAKVFLGNAGSALLGLVIAWVAFRLTQNPGHPVNPVLALWLLPIPVMDCLVLIVRRLREGRSPFSAGRDHIHHFMQDAGFGPTRAAVILAAFSMVCGMAAALAMRLNVPNPVLLAAFLLLCLGWYLLTSTPGRAVAWFGRLRRA
jgi:UDP-GlcNAc:undecaprenyl-phosphate GlcNAc-1-phosphate transferase